LRKLCSEGVFTEEKELLKQGRKKKGDYDRAKGIERVGEIPAQRKTGQALGKIKEP